MPVKPKEFDDPKKKEEDPFFSEENQRILKKRIRDYQKGKLTQHDIIEIEEVE